MAEDQSSSCDVAHIRSDICSDSLPQMVPSVHEIFGDAVFGMTDLETVRAFSPQELEVLGGMLAPRFNTPITSSPGRLFDAVASLIGLRQLCSFEGQAAMELEYALDTGSPDEVYPFEIVSRGNKLILNWEPLIRAILQEASPAAVPRKFPNTLARMMGEVAQRLGQPKVVLGISWMEPVLW